jgi:predicted RNase H-like HicB family nuclease
MKIKVILEPQEGGGYTVYAPSLQGCISEGNTREEALHNIKEAIELYLEVEKAEIKTVEGKEIVEVVL